MTPREQAADNASIDAVRHAALIAAITIQTRDDAGEVRHRAAAAALHGLADGAVALILPSEGVDSRETK